MHRDVSSDVQTSPAADRSAQQRQLDKWKQEFNHVRPHQALQGKTPAELYVRSTRKAAGPFTYPAAVRVTRVFRDGYTLIDGERHWISRALGGHYIGLELVDALKARAWFQDIDLGLLDVCPVVRDEVFLRTPYALKAEAC